MDKVFLKDSDKKETPSIEDILISNETDKIKALRIENTKLIDEIKVLKREKKFLKSFLDNYASRFENNRNDASDRDSGRTSSSPI